MEYGVEIVKVLESASLPLDTETIRTRAKIGHWNTCLKTCLELLIERKIKGIKTSKSWVFWIQPFKNIFDSENLLISLPEKPHRISSVRAQNEAKPKP